MNSQAMYSCDPLHTDEEGLGDQIKPDYNDSLLIQDVVRKTYLKRWTIETSWERVWEICASHTPWWCIFLLLVKWGKSKYKIKGSTSEFRIFDFLLYNLALNIFHLIVIFRKLISVSPVFLAFIVVIVLIGL